MDRENFVKFSDNEAIDNLLNNIVTEVKEFTLTQIDQIKKFTRIGTALSAERNLPKLLEMIVTEARKLTSADGGTLYIVSDDETELYFEIIQNDSLEVHMGGLSGKVTWNPVKLKNPDGTPNHANVSASSALTGEIINIPDVYHVAGFDFEGTKKFDSNTGYRSTSMLVVPMRNHENEIIGVLQLLNAQTLDKKVKAFSTEAQEITASLASQAAVAITNTRLIHNLENLFESFIRLIAAAIDEKSPYTGGHVRRVSELTLMIAEKINGVNIGNFHNISLNEDQIKELRIASWLHDIGKITTPEYVVDKATKLETIYDRFATVKTRFEILKRDAEIIFLNEKTQLQDRDKLGELEKIFQEKIRQLEDDCKFIERVNIGGEFMKDEDIARIKTIADYKCFFNGEEKKFLSENEVDNLCIRKGTLTNKEREVINNHATVTFKMLSQLPFSKKMHNVPKFAGSHHEKLDGSGYPKGLTEDQLSLQERIMALADVFEALTAADRPYKPGKKLSEAMKILSFMVKDKHIDKDLFDFFMKEKIYQIYAEKELPPKQIDEVK